MAEFGKAKVISVKIIKTVSKVGSLTIDGNRTDNLLVTSDNIYIPALVAQLGRALD